MTGPSRSRLSRRGGACPARRASSLSVISSAARNPSYGLSGDFSAAGVDLARGVAGFAAAGFAVPCGDFGAAAFPTVKYLRIFSRRFGPSPRIASKSSTLLNAPYDLRICTIFSAVAGPIPGTCCNSSDVAVLMFTGLAGGFFFALRTAGAQIKLRKRKRRENRNKKNRHAMAQL